MTFIDTHAHRQELYEAWSDVLDGVIYSAGNDNKCCVRCWPLDGTLWPTDESLRPRVPRHKDCRCLYIPKVSLWRELGLDEKKFEARKRPFCLRGKLLPNGKITLVGPRGGNLSKKIFHSEIWEGTMSEWIATLPPQIQKDFFNSEFSWRLWREGKIESLDLLDPVTWEPRTDDELRELIQRQEGG